MNESTVHRIRPAGVAWRAAGDEIVVLDTDNSVYFGLDHSAAVLWRRLVDGATAAELTAELTGSGPVDPDRAAHDVADFLDELDRYGLLRRS